VSPFIIIFLTECITQVLGTAGHMLRPPGRDLIDGLKCLFGELCYLQGGGKIRHGQVSQFYKRWLAGAKLWANFETGRGRN